jgi:hypothetical protein
MAKAKAGENNADIVAGAAAQRPEISKKFRANVAPADVTDRLKIDYVKPASLAKMGRFNIIDGYERTSRFGTECAFEFVIVEPGQNEGAKGTVTFKETPVRRKMIEIVRKSGSVGPYTLAPVGEEFEGNKPWGFVPADGSEVVADTAEVVPAPAE